MARNSKPASNSSQTTTQASPFEQDNQRNQTPIPSSTKANGAATKRNFKAAQRLTVPLISIAHTKFLMCEVKGLMYEADMNLGGMGETDNKPTICPVLNLDTNEDGLLICNEIIKSSFLKVEGGYVNRVFQLRSGDIAEGKRYRQVDVTLMEEEK